jgi:hypothetical protein
MFIAEESSHTIEAVFAGSKGFLWVLIMGIWNIMVLGYGSNTSDDYLLGSETVVIKLD